ncbi:MAG: phosphoribosylformylglycinamidine synthase [Desulfobacterales bacterium]|nr:phosphoribosylformylglycinamidine synthase [Desulfobacterales bacterium]
MPYRLEITLRPGLLDAEGDGICRKARDYFGIEISSIRTIHVVTIDANITSDQVEIIRNEIFTNPVTQVSSIEPLPVEFDWTIWVGFRAGVRDNPGSTAVEAIEDILGIKFAKGEAVYTSKRYCVSGKDLSFDDIDMVAGELLANDIIQQWKVISRENWDKDSGIGFIIPKVSLDHIPELKTIPIDTDKKLKNISDERNLALNPNDIPTIRNYFIKNEVQKGRKQVGLSDPTDIELEYISQARSDHCNHNTFQGLFRYKDLATDEIEVEDNLFKKYIKSPTLGLQKEKDWVVSVLWDNAGVGRFDEKNNYVITGETHNSPSNMEAYGGAITGIVGVYRDPLGTGKGSKLIMGSYGFCVGDRDYKGDLKPRLHPRRLLDGIIEGVKDGGNKSGVPTPFGQVTFHSGYMGKCLVFVTALGIMPSELKGEPSELKKTYPGDLIIMCGGRVGKDGIHGVTVSSEVFSENTPAGHVQIGDPYTQKKMHDFILEARDEGLMTFITDNGGGGLSSSVGESAMFAGGCEVWIEKVPLKYEGLDQWEIWISESQERMTIAVKPENVDRFLELSKNHAVESTIIGKYTDSGKLHIKYNEKTCAFIDLDLLESGFPQWEFDAEWQLPEGRGLFEPVINEPVDYNNLLKDILSRPNICSKEWIIRQYDHEVQGNSIIKPLVGVDRDVNSDACVINPVLGSSKGLGFSQAILPMYSAIDAYHMTACTIDEAVRRLISVGVNPEHIGGVDNFCWPDIQYHPEKNPDGKFKAAQLVRSCRALRDVCMAYGIPLLSGKDSMYVDGHLDGPYGETRKISALETLQFSATGLVDDILKCVTMDSKVEGDLVYILGKTSNELGGSEYYDHLGFIGANVPEVKPIEFAELYMALSEAIKEELVASSHGIYRGGLGIHLAMVSMGGNRGMNVSLDSVPVDRIDRNDTLLFSESAGRFIVTIDPENRNRFEEKFKKLPFALIGEITGESEPLIIEGKGDEKPIVSIPVKDLKEAWKNPFGDLI